MPSSRPSGSSSLTRDGTSGRCRDIFDSRRPRCDMERRRTPGGTPPAAPPSSPNASASDVSAASASA
eukprot:1830831-Prymnesium_polylepis.1